MDFALSDALQIIFDEDDGNWDKGVTRVYDIIARDFLFPNSSNLLIFAENHDTKRFNQIYKNDIRKYKMAMTMLATIRGIPQLYYGSEIGMAGDQNLGDADIRKDFPGGWDGDTNNAFTKEGRTEFQNEYFNFTSKLFNWRKTNDAVHFGKTTHYIPENNVYVYFRYNATKSVMVLVNNSPETRTIDTKRFQENIKNYKTAKEVLTDATFDLSKPISIEGKSALILELK